MNDLWRIVIGLIVFVVLITSPVWYDAAVGKPSKLNLESPVRGKSCVLERERMRDVHMELLNDWRERVVRGGERTFETSNGEIYDMSLTNTCLDCHSNKDKFCDRCHNYMGVDPYCWSCHVNPGEVR